MPGSEFYNFPAFIFAAMKLQSPQKFAAIFLSVTLGVIFIFSAFTKLFPIEPFEYTFVEFGLVGWQASVYFARIFIGLETACGLLLISNIWLRKFTLPFTAILLFFFILYLSIQLLLYGNTGNCGCFGNYFHMSPLAGIIKNILMLLAVAFIFFYHKGFSFKTWNLVGTVLISSALALPFIVNPIDLNISAQHYSGQLNYKLPLDILYEDANNLPPKVELRKGKWIIAFMSLTCPHCKIAAKKLRIIKKENPAIPIHLVLNGDKKNINTFFEETRANNVSWSVFNGSASFIKLAGTSLPAIVWVNNGIVENKTKYYILSQEEIEAWLAK